MHDLDLTFRMGQGQMLIYQLIANVGLLILMALVMYDQYATLYEIFGVEIWMTLILIFRMGQGQM